MKAYKTFALGLLSVVTVCFGAIATFNNGLRKTDAEQTLVTEVLDDTCTFDFDGNNYDGKVTSKSGDDLYITIENGFKQEGYFVCINAGGYLAFDSQPLKGAVSVKVKGTGRMSYIGTLDTTYENNTQWQDFTLENSEITIDLGVGADHFTIGASMENSYIEEITINCTCSPTEITDDYYAVTSVSSVSDELCFKTVTSPTNHSQVSTEVRVPAGNYLLVRYLLPHIDVGYSDIAFDFYSSDDIAKIEVTVHDDIAGLNINQSFQYNTKNSWETFTLTTECTYADLIQISVFSFVEAYGYIDNIRAVEK